MKLPIYLDYSSTTPVDKRVVKKMMKYLTLDGIFGNPSSKSHIYGWKALEAIDIARNNISNLIGSSFLEIIFTSGATESNNLALKGVAYANKNKGRHIISSLTEHKSVINTLNELKNEGFDITFLSPLSNGIITPKQLNNALRDNTILVSLMHVNNETGIIQNIKEFGILCKAHGAIFHVDAAQSLGKIPINLNKIPVDLMSFSAHKLYGPKGIGFLFIRRKSNIKIKTQIHGGGQECGFRSGTLPVHQIVGMGEACYLAKKLMKTEIIKTKTLRNKLWYNLKNMDNIYIHGDPNKSISTILNVGFKNKNKKNIIFSMKDIAISSGSACISGNIKSSYVLRSMGIVNKIAKNSIRFSIGRFTTKEEINYTINYIKNIFY